MMLTTGAGTQSYEMQTTYKENTTNKAKIALIEKLVRVRKINMEEAILLLEEDRVIKYPNVAQQSPAIPEPWVPDSYIPNVPITPSNPWYLGGAGPYGSTGMSGGSAGHTLTLDSMSEPAPRSVRIHTNEAGMRMFDDAVRDSAREMVRDMSGPVGQQYRVSDEVGQMPSLSR